MKGMHIIKALAASLVAQKVENLPAMQETGVHSLGWEDSPGGGHGHPLQYSCLENPHGQRGLVGCSPWGCKESDKATQQSTDKAVKIRSTREESSL